MMEIFEGKFFEGNLFSVRLETGFTKNQTFFKSTAFAEHFYGCIRKCKYCATSPYFHITANI